VVIRIDRSAPEGGGLTVDASLVDEADPTQVICSTTIHFDADTTEVAAIVQLQKDLSLKATHRRKIDGLSQTPPRGQDLPFED
jgi:hypothetical protein